LLGGESRNGPSIYPGAAEEETNLAQAYVNLKKKKMRVLREQEMRMNAADL
jgi:hypothetical protein